MKFRDFVPGKLDQLTKVDWDDIRLLWHSGYWDGPKSGMLSYQGKKYWFQTIDDDEATVRRFLILELSGEQMREQEYWHELFRQKVGTHTDYDETGRHELGALRPGEMWREFYDAYEQRQPLDLSNNLIVGWFEN
jgi:hypothetical protein